MHFDVCVDHRVIAFFSLNLCTSPKGSLQKYPPSNNPDDLGAIGKLLVDGSRRTDDASPPNLSWGDVTFDHASEPSVMKIHLRTSKCDQYGKGADVFVGKTGNTLCPIAACLAYLALRGTTDPGAFFLKPDKRPLLKPVFVAELRKALGTMGLHQAAYAGHSFRIGAATAAASAGVEDSTIQLMGRWNSAAFLGYIRTPGSQFAAITPRLARQS
eukprot:Em0001g3483a